MIQSQEANAIVNNIMQILAKHRKSIPGQASDIFSDNIRNNLANFIENNEPIRAVLPAFPEKSVSRDKTISNKADMAERLTLKYFKSIIDEIKKVYPAGLEIQIYSDGGAFDGMLDEGYTKENRRQYIQDLNQMIKQEGLNNIITVNYIDDIKQTLDNMGYVESIQDLQARVRNPQSPSDRDTVELYSKMKPFWSKEIKSLHPNISVRQLESRAKEMAYNVVRYSVAFGNYIENLEPNVLRISCHAKDIASGKIGLKFDQNGTHATPWHNTAMIVPDLLQNNSFLHKKDDWHIINAKTARQNFEADVRYDTNGNPSHMEASQKASAAVVIQRKFREKLSARRLSTEQQQLSGITTNI